MKTPLLDELRAKRELEETEIKAPVVDRLNIQIRENYHLADQNRKIQRIAIGDFGKHVLDEFARQFSRMIYEHFINALETKDELISITISKNMLKMMTPSQFEYEAMHRYAQHMNTNAQLNVRDAPTNQKQQILSVYIPKFDVHKTIEIEEI